MTAPVALVHEHHGPDPDPDAADGTAAAGPPPTVLLVHGLGAMAAWWPPAVVDGLAARHEVIVPDLRDSGRSPTMTGTGSPSATFEAWARGEALRPPYGLRDMAADLVGLLDDHDVARVHVVGASLGGMVAQHLAFGWPGRVASLTSIMSTTGDQSLPVGDPEVISSLTEEVAWHDEDSFVAVGVARARQLSRSPVFDEIEAARRYRAYWAVDADRDPDRSGRQLAAVLADGDRTDRLGTIGVPTLVLHGTNDAMIPIDAGRATAAAVPAASFVELDLVGHELPGLVADQVVAEITALVARAEQLTTP